MKIVVSADNIVFTDNPRKRDKIDESEMNLFINKYAYVYIMEYTQTRPLSL